MLTHTDIAQQNATMKTQIALKEQRLDVLAKEKMGLVSRGDGRKHDTVIAERVRLRAEITALQRSIAGAAPTSERHR
jgi:hypothetical protein